MKNKKNILLMIIILVGLFPMQFVAGSDSGAASLENVLNLNNLPFNNKNSIGLSGDGKYLAAAIEGNVTLYELSGCDPNVLWSKPAPAPKDVHINHDGSKIIYADEDEEKIYCYPLSGAPLTWEFQSTLAIHNTITTSTNGEYVMYSETTPNYIYHFVNASDNTEFWNFQVTGNVYGKEISDDGHVVLFQQNGTLIYFDTSGELWRKQLDTSIKYVKASNDGHILVTSGVDYDNITLYDSTGSKLWEKADLSVAIWGGEIAKDSNEILIATNDPSKSIWSIDFESGESKWQITHQGENNSRGLLSNNGKVAAVWESNSVVRIIDVATGSVLYVHNSNPYMIWDVEFSDDGRTLAVLYPDGTVYIFSIIPSESKSFFENYLDSVTDTDNLYALISTALVGFLLGSMIFGCGRKKKVNKKKSKK